MTSPVPESACYYYDVFGITMRVARRDGQWLLFRQSGDGKSLRVRDFSLPPELDAMQLISFLDDMYHEQATPEHPAVIRVGTQSGNQSPREKL